MSGFVLILVSILMFPVIAFAQGTEVSEIGQYVIDLSSFAGVVALIGSIVTQVTKVSSYVSSNKWLQIVLAILIGIALSFASWFLGISPVVEGLIWWQTLVVGVLSGIGSMGLYDLVSMIYSLITKK